MTRESERRVPAIIVVAVVFVLFAAVMAWAIEEGRELGLLGAALLSVADRHRRV
jgi:hypothetical protein